MKDIYLTVAGALGQERALDHIANNLANVSTIGFKKDRAVFLDYFQVQAPGTAAAQPTASADPANPAACSWPTTSRAYTDLRSGPLQNTQQPLDLAIEGEGFFTVELPGQTEPLYTRAGNFRLSDQGELVTPSGHRVLDETSQPIRLDLSRGTPVITPAGDILLGGQPAGRIGIVSFDNPEQLRKWGEGLMVAPAGTTPRPVEASSIRQGALEDSNVNPIEEMVKMIQAQRIYETQQKALQTVDGLTEQRIRDARE